MPNRSAGPAFTNVPRTASAVSEVRPHASCMDLEVRPASEVERFVAFARANGCQCRVTFRDNPTPLFRDFEAAVAKQGSVIGRTSWSESGPDIPAVRAPTERVALAAKHPCPFEA